MEELKVRKKVAIYIDYVLRMPNFIESYKLFRNVLFVDENNELNVEDEIQESDPRFYWKEQMKNIKIEQFYIEVRLPKDESLFIDEEFKKYFYNEEHYLKFLDEYSVNLYVDAKVINNKDIDVINIAQELLFDIVLIDQYKNKRKKSNTLFYLSKIRVYPQQIIFLGENFE